MTVGKKLVYFPDFIVTMVRSSLPPNQIVLRVPIHLGKLDIRDYLVNLYNVKPKDVRTMIYQGATYIEKGTRRKLRKASYKKAIITLEEEFEYPAPPNLKDFGEEQTKLAIEKIKKKMKGWRAKAPLDSGKTSDIPTSSSS